MTHCLNPIAVIKLSCEFIYAAVTSQSVKHATLPGCIIIWFPFFWLQLLHLHSWGALHGPDVYWSIGTFYCSIDNYEIIGYEITIWAILNKELNIWWNINQISPCFSVSRLIHPNNVVLLPWDLSLVGWLCGPLSCWASRGFVLDVVGGWGGGWCEMGLMGDRGSCLPCVILISWAGESVGSHTLY